MMNHLALKMSLIGSSLVLAGVAAAQVQDLPVSTALVGDHGDVVASGPTHGGGIERYMSVEIAAENLRVLVPIDIVNDPARTTELLKFVQKMITETVLSAPSSTDIGTWRDNGTLHAVEALFLDSNNPPGPASTEALATTGDVEGDLGEEVGTLYCYDQALYDARVSALETSLGHALEQHTIWLDPVFQTNGPALALRVNGTGNTFHGDVQTSGKMVVEGSNHELSRESCYGATLEVSGTGHLFGAQTHSAAEPLPAIPHDQNWYDTQATADGTRFVGDISIVADSNGLPVTQTGSIALNGKTVYSTGNISVIGDGIQGSFTLVAEGSIDFVGDNCDLGAAVDHMLAISFSADPIDSFGVSGDSNSFTGTFRATNLRAEITGSDNLFTGSVVAKKGRVLGDDNILSDGTE